MPFSVGAQGGGVDIEPFTSIMRHAPLCYWRLNETSSVALVNSGSLGTARNVTSWGGGLAYSQLKIATRSPNTSIGFDGTTTFGEVSGGGAIGGTNPTFSLGCWIRTSTAVSNAALICQRDGTNGGSGFEFKIGVGAYLSFQGVTTSGVNDFSFLSQQLNNLNDNLNHYVSATVRSDTVILYMNGIEVGNFEGRSGGIWSALPKIFLGQISGGAERFNGNMSDAFITSQVLTQADHYKIWRAGMLHAPTSIGSNFLDAITLPHTKALTVTPGFNLNTYTIEPPDEPGQQTPVVSYTRGINSGHSVWFKFPSSAAGNRLRVTADGRLNSAYNYIELFKNTNGTIGGLEYIKNSVSYFSVLSHIVAAGETYYVRVRTYYASNTIVDLSYDYVTPPPPPANDNFANAQVINTTVAGQISGALDGSTIEFPLETDDWTQQPNSVWYKFVADETGSITIDTALSPDVDMVLEIFENTTLAAIQANPYSAVASNQTSGPALTVLITLPVVAGNTYHIQASDFGTLSNFIMKWSDILPPPAAPANNNLASATTMNVVTGGNVAGTTAGATVEVAGETNNASGFPSSVWYKFQADATGNITLDTELTSSVDTYIYVFAGTAGSVIGDFNFSTPIFHARDDDSGALNSSLVTFAVTNTTWYYVQITDFNALGAAFTLRWSDII